MSGKTGIRVALAALAAIVLAGCETTGSGDTTHVTHSVTAEERALVQSTLSAKLKAPGVQIESLKATEHLGSGAVIICGYVTGITSAGTRSKPAVFGGMISANQKSAFSLFGGGGAGQDANRANAVRAICDANYVNV